MVECKVLLSPSHGGRRILRDNMTINTHANCQRLIASRLISEWCRRSFCSHLIFVANTLTFGGRGEVQRMLQTRTIVLYSPIIHGSLRPPVSTDLTISKNMGTPACMTFFVCRNGLGNGQYLSVAFAIVPSKGGECCVFSCVKMRDGAITVKVETRNEKGGPLCKMKHGDASLLSKK